MLAGYQSLTEKEKQTLRLIVRGHDAKSSARRLGLSVHTVNERLREARRKLQVSSSRAAARLVLDTEGDDPQKLVDKQIGADSAVIDGEQGPTSAIGPLPSHRSAVTIAGGIIMSIFLGAFALSLSVSGTGPSASTDAAQSTPAVVAPAVAESEAVRSARDWLMLGDQKRWKDGWIATASSFRQLNTPERWAEAAEKVRVPLGAVVSRIAFSQESVPAPPAGVEVVKFRTNFTNKSNVIETVSMAREESAWKVVGIYVE